MSEVERYQPPSIAALNEYAEKFAISKMFKDINSAAQAFIKISAGAELGLSPFQSMTGVHIINGKPVVGAGLLASLLDRDPAYDYRVEWDPNEANPTACTVVVIKNGNERGRSRFSMEDAKRADLVKPGGNWIKYPASMLFARAMSNAVRWYAPGATGMSVYVEGELEPPAPAARVTASVQRFNDPVASHPDDVVYDATTGEVLDDDPASIPHIPFGGLAAALGELDPVLRAELFTAVGITMRDGKVEPPVSLAHTRALLAAKWSDLELPDYQDGEPVPVTLLGAIRSAGINADRDEVPA